MTASQRPAAPAPRRVRRALVLSTYLGYLGMVLAWSFLPHPERWFLVIPLGLFTLIGLNGLLRPQQLGVSEGSDEQLDERQIALRNRSYLNAYRILATLVILSAIYFMLAQDINRERGWAWWLPESDREVQALFWGLWLVAVTLPTAITAWTEPNLDGERSSA